MVSDVHFPIATGVSMFLTQGWQFEATKESAQCFEIMMSKDQAQACLRLIALGEQDMNTGYSNFRFTLLESLVAFGCEIDPVDATRGNLISGTHPKKSGKIHHYLRKTNPVIHLSAGGVSSPEQLQELVLMADSISLDEAWVRASRKGEFGQLLSFELNEKRWQS